MQDGIKADQTGSEGKPPPHEMMMLRFLLPIGAWISAFALTHAESLNGFDISNASVPAAEILSGGPPRDGIPSIDAPKFISASKADFLRNEDIVISLTRGSVTRAYPLRILAWHEIVNDVIGGDPVAVTYCPLCGTSMVFDRKIGGKVRSFGVSGRERNSFRDGLLVRLAGVPP